MNQSFTEEINNTAHGGINQRLNGRMLATEEFTDLVNVDISIPGIRFKRKEHLLIDDLLAATVPPTPTGLSASSGVCKIMLSWGAVTGADSYQIKLYSGASCAGTAISTINVSAVATSYLLTGLTSSTAYSWTVQAIGDGVSYADSLVSACASFTTGAVALDDDLPDAVYNVAYSADVAASGGTAPYTYAVTSGSVPTGLTLSSAGVLSGTPSETTDLIFGFTITATDANNCTGSRAYLVVSNGEVPECSLATRTTWDNTWVQVTGDPITIGHDTTGPCGVGYPILANSTKPWDGFLFYRSSPSPLECRWINWPLLDPLGTYEPVGGGNWGSWQGSDLSGAYPNIQVTLVSFSYWQLRFNVQATSGGKHATYRKTYGSTVDGVYTAICPVTVPQTMTVTSVTGPGPSYGYP